MNSEYEVVAFVSDWKYKHKSPFDAYTDMIGNYVESPALKETAKKQYKEGYSVQDIVLNDKKLTFIIFENNNFIHPSENMETFLMRIKTI